MLLGTEEKDTSFESEGTGHATLLGWGTDFDGGSRRGLRLIIIRREGKDLGDRVRQERRPHRGLGKSVCVLAMGRENLLGPRAASFLYNKGLGSSPRALERVTTVLESTMSRWEVLEDFPAPAVEALAFCFGVASVWVEEWGDGDREIGKGF